MTAQTIRDLAGRLENHRLAFMGQGGFDALQERSEKPVEYLGRGGSFKMPDNGTEFEVFADGWAESGTVKVFFFSPITWAAKLSSSMGTLRLTAAGDTIEVQSDAIYKWGSFAKLEAAASVFGSWMREAVSCSQVYQRERERTRVGQSYAMDRIASNILHPEGMDPGLLAVEACAAVVEVIRMGEGFAEPFIRAKAGAGDLALMASMVDNSSVTAGREYTPGRLPNDDSVTLVRSPGSLLPQEAVPPTVE
jgi:hypothetical protein